MPSLLPSTINNDILLILPKPSRPTLGPTILISHRWSHLFLFWLSTSVIFNRSSSQSISENLPLPPMEWIKLQPTGSTSPPPLSHGCLVSQSTSGNNGGSTSQSSTDSINRAYLFGGRSNSETVSNSIYTIDFSSASSSGNQTPQPTWSQPDPPSSALFTSSPSPRSHLICGWDSSSNFRNQLNIYGGRSQDGQPLNDFWHYDSTNRFWAQPKSFQPTPNPYSIYGAVGGPDPTFTPSSPSTSNSLFFIGGSNSTHSNPDLHIYALSVDGQLASNTDTINVNLTDLQSGVTGDASSINMANGRWGITGTVLPGPKMVLFSGCNTDPAQEFASKPDPSCSLPTGGVLKFDSGFSPSSLSTSTKSAKSSWQPIKYCPAPRIGGQMVPNRNSFDSSFANQVIMFGGRIDSRNWDDQGGSGLGEVDVYDTSSGLWARVLPARRNNATFTPKEGVLALAFPYSLGSSSSSSGGSTDILVYGGIDVRTGQASSELWILRLYGAKLTGNGTAAGISMSYLPSCVTPTSQNKMNLSDPSTGVGGDSGTSGDQGKLTVPSGHIIFSAFSLAAVMVSLTVLRLEEPAPLAILKRWRTAQLWVLLSAWQLLFLGYSFFAIAIAIALVQPRVTGGSTLKKRGLFNYRGDSPKLSVGQALRRSSHAKIGFVIAILAGVVVPALYLLSWLVGYRRDSLRRKRMESGGPRKLKVKEAPSLERARRMLEKKLFRLGEPWKGLNRSTRNRGEPSGQHRLERMGEKASSLNEEANSGEAQHSSASSSAPFNDQKNHDPPPAHGRVGSNSTAHTNSGLLSKALSDVKGATDASPGLSKNDPHPSKEVSSDSAPQSHPNAHQETPSKDRPPVLKALYGISTSFLQGKRSNSGMRDKLEDESSLQDAPAAEPNSPKVPFEVLNRKSPRQRGGQPRRMSLDIMSEPGDNEAGQGQVNGSVNYQHDDRLSESRYQDYEEYGEEGKSDDDDDDDDSSNRKVKARSGLRRLADAMLHLVLLLVNGYMIANCLLSDATARKVLGGLYASLCLICYGVVLWLAWNGKPSYESTLVIFMSIIKDGPTGTRNQPAVNNDQFSSYGQQHPQSVGGTRNGSLMDRRINPDFHASLGGSNYESSRGFYNDFRRSELFMSSVGGDIPDNETYFGTSVAGGGGRLLEEELRSSEGGYTQDFHHQQQQGLGLGSNCGVGGGIGIGVGVGGEVGERYLSEREVQIITTAPKRKLTVVNG